MVFRFLDKSQAKDQVHCIVKYIHCAWQVVGGAQMHWTTVYVHAQPHAAGKQQIVLGFEQSIASRFTLPSTSMLICQESQALLAWYTEMRADKQTLIVYKQIAGAALPKQC